MSGWIISPWIERTFFPRKPTSAAKLLLLFPKRLNLLCGLYLFSPLVLLLFSIIYPIVLDERHRMNRPLGISCLIFAANILIQGVLVLAVLVCTYGG